ncbi:uncharacterized protein [Typha angustifolia]|uniref:uncharacterized protein n=1 Tax=Typha angustifolia TaxID=59011 RepID=UPI003C3024C2
MEEEEGERELQLLFSNPLAKRLDGERKPMVTSVPPADHPALDLTLKMSVGPALPEGKSKMCVRSMQVLKQQTAEQIRLAAVEKAYAERVRELARREVEMAEKEFAKARAVWERAREEVEKVERMKEMASRRIGSACLEITCQACRQRFCP